MGVLLPGYNYDIEYLSSKKNSADALSRLPAATCNSERSKITYFNFVEKFLPMSHHDVWKATATDKLLSKILLYTQSGWPSTCTEHGLNPFYSRRNELYSELLMFGLDICHILY